MSHKKDNKKTYISRRQQQQKRQLLFLAIIFCLFVGILTVLFLHQSNEPDPVSMQDEYVQEDDNAIVYNGKRYTYNNHISNYLFMGIDESDTVDAQKTQADAGQADVIFLLSYDRKENTLKSLAIPRDTMTQIESFSFSGNSQGMQENHLNLQYAFGDGKWKSCELMKTAVSNLLYGLPIQGYCSVKMDAVPILVDLVGGVQVTVEDDSIQQAYPEFTQGSEVTLSKDNALDYIRFRDIMAENSALVRQQRHKSFLDAFLKKVQTLSGENIGIVTDVYEGITPYMVTNMGIDLFVDLLDASIANPIVNETVPGEGQAGEFHDEYHVDEDALFALILQMFYKEIQ